MTALRRGLRLTLHDPQRGAPDSARQPPVLALAEPLSAALLERVFNEHRAEWFADDVADSAQRIAELLAGERELSERWQGLPGTEHPQHWHEGASESRAVVQSGLRGRRFAVWHPSLCWVMPLVRRRARHLKLELPLAASLGELETMIAAALPPAWRRKRVCVRLEVETRVYWGARATRSHGAPPQWQPCRVRGDGLANSEELFVLRRGHAVDGTVNDDTRPRRTASTLQEGAALLGAAQRSGGVAEGLTARLQRHLHGGVGLLVAVPVVSYERPASWRERLHGRVDDWWAHVWRRIGWVRRGDRDPTFVHRLEHDEPFWLAATGSAALAPDAWQRALVDGAVLRPASRAAACHQPRGGDASLPRRHVVLVHGGLTSARHGFDGWLAATPSPDGPLWPHMPALDEALTWRFEHDTFVPLVHNIARLERWLARAVIGDSREGQVVLIAHSRGGSVVRFALERLRQRFGPGWTFHALTAGAPHLGTQVFRRIGHRWAGLAALVGAVRKLGESWLNGEQLARLVILERGLAYEVPAGFHDVEPSSVLRMAHGKPHELPDGMWLWGSAWGPAAAHPVEDGLWHWLVEDIGGAEVGGDGLVARESALAGRVGDAIAHDASPVFHTHYFMHEPTREQMARVLAQLLAS